MSLSANGQYLLLAGYNAAPATTGIASTSAATISRVVGRVDSAGNVDTSTTFGSGTGVTNYSGNNIRGAVSSDGTSIWATGPGGINYTTFGSTVAGTAIAAVNTRVNGVDQGQLYTTSASVPNTGVNMVGLGLPTSGPAAVTNLRYRRVNHGHDCHEQPIRLRPVATQPTFNRSRYGLCRR